MENDSLGLTLRAKHFRIQINHKQKIITDLRKTERK